MQELNLFHFSAPGRRGTLARGPGIDG